MMRSVERLAIQVREQPFLAGAAVGAGLGLLAGLGSGWRQRAVRAPQLLPTARPARAAQPGPPLAAEQVECQCPDLCPRDHDN